MLISLFFEAIKKVKESDHWPFFKVPLSKIRLMRYDLSEVTEVIQNRRTVSPEKFSGRKVHREIVENLLNNGLWAPTHGMTQPWKFVVFIDEGVQRLADFYVNMYKSQTSEGKFLQSKEDKYKARFEKTNVVIAICMNRQESEKIPEIEEIGAVACAVQNIHLTATAYGLGGFWSTGSLVYSTEMKTFLELGEKDRCLGLFYLGYPENEWAKGQRQPLEYKSKWITE